MGNSNIRRNSTRTRFTFEHVEARLFLSASQLRASLNPRALALTAQSQAQICVQPMFDDASGISGYSPAQIRNAYGFDKIQFANGVAGDGAGQTIAIVDAFDDPNIESDLHTFSQSFNLSDPPSFTKVSQTGGSTASLQADQGWSGEIALDVEWAHAVAPKANIMLVETNSDSLNDLLAGVDYARHAAGVSVVSMSWGTTEFWSQGMFDPYFMTPAGHQGVTFVAASGDFSSRFGPSWPSTSPNVLSVGGTSLMLNTSDTSDMYVSETGWRLSTGGISQFESQPKYQLAAQHTGRRTSPDVSYNADPNTGFAVYDSFGSGGWGVVGGTSAGAPQWAALIAIANQGRAINGNGTLDSGSTLGGLYKDYSAATYGSDFHDITVGRTSFFLGAHSGYDGVTGLGTPQAQFVIGSLMGTTTITITNGVHRPSTRRLHLAPQPPPTVLPPTPAPVTDAPVETAALPQPFNLTAGAPAMIVSHLIESQASDLVGAAGASMGADDDGGGAFSALRGAAAGGAIWTGAGAVRSAIGADLAGTFSHSPIAPDQSSAARNIAAAVESLPAALASAAVSPRALLDAIASPATSAPRKTFEFARFGAPFTLLADSVAAFTEESALISTSLAPNARTRSAWMVTLAVVGVDALLVTHYLRKSRKTRTRVRGRAPMVLEGEEIAPG